MSGPLELSARFIDEGIYEGPESVNRVTTELSELAHGIAVIEAYAHVFAFDTDDGLVLFDTSSEAFAKPIIKSLRQWSSKRLHTVVYTHGHIDHVGGAQALIDEAKAKGHAAPRVVGHEAVQHRFVRYRTTLGYNRAIYVQLFGRTDVLTGEDRSRSWGPSSWVAPNTTFRDRLGLRVGGLEIQLRHAKGETDDHLWAWLPQHKAICSGDFVSWVFPNVGNPQKVQRFPLEWAAALREMSGLDAELLLPSHGLPIAGIERVRSVLITMASALESLVEQTLELMNEGAPLDTIIHSVSLPEQFQNKPYLQPVYDDPEFIVHNIWRLYGGWYDGNPAHLKPAPDAVVARELANLAGGANRLAVRARETADAGDLRLACHLVEMAVQADDESREAHGARAEIYTKRRKAERSLFAKGIYRTAALESTEFLASR